ncbi:hypothetical protein KX928_14030 [Roseobacter sp. YSTF-M11]|uniref:Lipid A biosynthesis lauroyl acyltransferase n=1 Tax=Roseobacter insulae TaxID=2859783 RepID=A0A9X1FWE1_9RHOB|nr:hypothetical protein [Roseobacter insulae]MBW4708903.1 hypothetical protein [Roseobacter insulae]
MAQQTERSAEHILPLLAKGDFGLILTEPVHALLARMVTSDANNRLIARLARLATRLRPGKQAALARLYAALLGGRAANMPDPAEYATDLIEAQLLQRMFYARLAKDATWRPEFTVRGAEHVAQARRDNRGIVFWTIPQEITALLLRMTCHDRQWDLHHLSHRMHGQSVSRLGMAVFNRRDCRIEDHLSKRIWMTEETTKLALTQASAVVTSGGCVGFRGIGWSKRPMYFPFFEGHIHLAFGAPVLARRTGATLLTVAANKTDTGFELMFEPLAVDKSRSLNDVGQDFVGRLEKAVVQSPGLWPAKSRQWAAGAPPVPFGERTVPARP